MSRKRRRRNPVTGTAKVRWNPTDTTKIVVAVAATAVIVGGIGAILYFKKAPALTTTPPAGGGGTATPTSGPVTTAPNANAQPAVTVSAAKESRAYREPDLNKMPNLDPNTGNY